MFPKNKKLKTCKSVFIIHICFPWISFTLQYYYFFFTCFSNNIHWTVNFHTLLCTITIFEKYFIIYARWMIFLSHIFFLIFLLKGSALCWHCSPIPTHKGSTPTPPPLIRKGCVPFELCSPTLIRSLETLNTSWYEIKRKKKRSVNFYLHWSLNKNKFLRNGDCLLLAVIKHKSVLKYFLLQIDIGWHIV